METGRGEHPPLNEEAPKLHCCPCGPASSTRSRWTDRRRACAGPGGILIGARPTVQGRQTQSTRSRYVRSARATHCQVPRETATEVQPPGTGASLANNGGAVRRISCAVSRASRGSTFRISEPRRKPIRESAAHLGIGRRQATAPIGQPNASGFADADSHTESCRRIERSGFCLSVSCAVVSSARQASFRPPDLRRV
jgi:hypothetical protein